MKRTKQQSQQRWQRNEESMTATSIIMMADDDIKSGAVSIIMYERLSKLRRSFFVFWKNLI
jgi:hypothetical protein